MYLKAIEIYGFKSFANKVKLPLKPGITCIVGPNGCGKSNVVDSLKWCIGEMSWKSLRLPSMMDVVFAGTAKRQQLNMAEVAMTFDNESRKLPLDFSEVTVTRKIYRSEESEYFINKVQCRLKDIREMFLDTGIGTDGYAIIDQGEVEYVLSASPEERRELFEEAAGVSKYKAKREEALRRLEKVDADLARLADATTLIDEQIKKLDLEAKRARTRQKYQEEFTAAEVSMLVKEISGLNGEVANENAALEPVQRELSETAAAITALEGELAAMNLTLAQKQEEERVLNEGIASVKFEKVRLEGTIVHNGELSEEVASQSRLLEASGKRNEEAIAGAAPRIEEARAALANSEASLAALKTDHETGLAELAKIDAEMNAVDAAVAVLEKEITAAYQSEVELSNEIASTGSSIGHYKENIFGLKKDLEGLNSRRVELLARIGALKARLAEGETALAAEKSALAETENARNGSAARLGEIDKRLNELNAEKTGVRSRLEAILSQGEKDSYWVGINGVLNSGVPGIRGTLRHLLTIKKEDRLAVEEALGRFLDAVVCDNLERAQEAIAHLKHLGKGRCRFILLDRAGSPEAPAAEWEVPNAVKIRGKIECAPEYEGILARLLNGVYASGGSVTGSFWVSGGVEAVTSNEPYWEEEGELKEKIRGIEEEEAKLSAERTEVSAKLAAASARAAELEEKINALNLDLHRARVEAENADGEGGLNARNIDFTAAETAKAETTLAEAESRLADFNARLESARGFSEEKRSGLAVLAGRKDALHAAHSKANEDIGARKANLDNHQKNLELLKGEAARLDTQLSARYAEREHSALRAKELAERAVQLAAETEEARKRLLEVMSELAEKELLEKQLSGELHALRNDYSRLNINLNDSRELGAEGEKKRYGMELRINTLKTRSEELTKRLNEEWSLGVEDAREKFGAVEVDAERVKFLRKRLEGMGAVNMTAPEEYDALITRFNFMNSQVEDLNKAKADLRSAIAKINETTRDNFKSTFDKVQVHFKQIYSLLFNGGEADLILTQPENILETGVEILAHPPGKKLVSISQLSGGEKALTALALLFSFFCVNPSPFCVMDEADAPLDEANVERFVRLLREFSGTTQFIVITHNKRTMEAADVLYGVTMEEMGVSKLISVDLRKASAMTESGGKVKAQVGA
ncbi:MAG: chromosome segregation protein SMC [Elusimicrobia bacterium GWA2_56_46]|nr:MAG: chromosome segregation protein SMC [Elusimicrobia bacterium GWA2_56_46]OGR54865.1 MAG: chromosome segregation protein SMC [Elusimicrobia bacterium GWC2_56_31]HBW23341.1 chromosome segregation protein SMC [Elusimicrobiota bacterium]